MVLTDEELSALTKAIASAKDAGLPGAIVVDRETVAVAVAELIARRKRDSIDDYLYPACCGSYT